MSRPQTSQVFPFGIPIRGLDFVSPLAAMSSEYTPWLENFLVESQFIRIRFGNVIHCTPAGADKYILGMGVYGSGSTAKLFAYTQESDGAAGAHQIWDVSTSTPAEETVAALADDTNNEAYPLNFGGKLGFIVESDATDCAVYYDGSWNDLALTHSGTAINCRVGTYYKGRFYLFESTSMYYSDTVGAANGTCTQEDLTEVFSDEAIVQWAAPLSAPGERSENTYLAMGNATGEVLVYGGDNPGSVTWELIARFKISPPIGNNTILEYRNDLWILTMTGVVSLRDLLTKGSRAAQDLTVSWKIDPYWVKLASGLNVYNAIPKVSAAFWPEENKVFILFNQHVNEAGTTSSTTKTMLVYNCATEAWSMLTFTHCNTSSTVHSLTYYKNNLYFVADEAVMVFDVDSTRDQTFNDAGTIVQYDADLYSAYNLLGSNNKHKRVTGFEPVWYLDALSNIRMRAQADFGRKTTSYQVYNGINYDFASYTNPFMGIGIEGMFIRWHLNVQTSPLGNERSVELYSVGVALK